MSVDNPDFGEIPPIPILVLEDHSEPLEGPKDEDKDADKEDFLGESFTVHETWNRYIFVCVNHILVKVIFHTHILYFQG